MPGLCYINGKKIINPSKRQRELAKLCNKGFDSTIPSITPGKNNFEKTKPVTPDIKFSCHAHEFDSPKKICQDCIISNNRKQKLRKKLNELF